MEPEEKQLLRFTSKSRLETAVNTVKGLLLGIAADERINNLEIKALIHWTADHREFAERHPFNEILPLIQTVVADGVIDAEERKDLLWLAEQITAEDYYDDATTSLQELHGFLAGILADGVISESELNALSLWLDKHAYLRSCWPYDEVDSLVTAVMADGVIDDAEHEILVQFFGQFASSRGERSVAGRSESLTIEGVCASCPTIDFEGSLFCFTGKSERASRSELASIVESKGSRFKRELVNNTDYLVVGVGGNPCWAYSCYGRKVEDAVRRRKEGQRLVIVHEYDFWDEIGD